MIQSSFDMELEMLLFVKDMLIFSELLSFQS